jgi:nitrite reductase/ring-hydroxylating ferredoxin subunit
MARSLMEQAAPDAGHAWVAVCTHRGTVPVGIERLHEIALDWRRLPHVHHHTIGSIVCLSFDAASWRARVSTAGGASWDVELLLDRRARCCRLRLRQDAGGGVMVRVTVQPRSLDQSDVQASLFVADQSALDLAGLREQWLQVIGLFWEGDEAMMVERQRQIDRRVDVAGPDRQREFGLREGLALPLVFELGSREFVLADVGGQLVAFPRRCPHQLGPLDGALDGRLLTCPWHGYQFDVVTGENVSGGECRLTGMPDVDCSGGRVIVRATH